MDPRWEWEWAWEGVEPTPLPSARPLRCAAAGAGAGPWTPTVEAGLLYGWRSRMVQSRDPPGMHTNHANHAGHCPGIPHITYCWLLHGCSDAADLGGKKSMEAGRTMSPSPACLDRHTGTRICRLTTRTRGAIAGIHHEASRLPPPATPLPPPCGWQSSAQCALSRLRLRSRKIPRFPRRFHARPPRFSPVAHSFNLPGGRGGEGEWEVGWWHTPGRRTSNRSEDPAISSHRGEKREKGTSCFVLPGRPSPSPPAGRRRWKR